MKDDNYYTRMVSQKQEYH